MGKALAGLALAGLLSGGAARPTASPRPPQFVVVSFDDCRSLAMWKRTRKLARRLRARFTYFVSSVYFLTRDKGRRYRATRHKRLVSTIGYGRSHADILGRIGQVNRAVTEGHEIASHGNGHADGSRWTYYDWRKALGLFETLFFDTFRINGLRPGPGQPRRLAVRRQQLLGFRAPHMARSPALSRALQASGYRYDASLMGKPWLWPSRAGGTWKFRLARIRMSGSGAKLGTMDLMFKMVQRLPATTNRWSRKWRYRDFKLQMLETYLRYFRRNYNGNRAPIQIAHHFKLYYGGIYWEVLQDFLRRVCPLPEVRCVSYRELLAFLEKARPGALAGYQAGRFPRGKPFRHRFRLRGYY